MYFHNSFTPNLKKIGFDFGGHQFWNFSEVTGNNILAIIIENLISENRLFKILILWINEKVR